MEVQQDAETFDIRVTCRETTKKLKPIHIAKGRIKHLDQPTLQEERDQLRSVNGSLVWIEVMSY